MPTDPRSGFDPASTDPPLDPHRDDPVPEDESDPSAETHPVELRFRDGRTERIDVSSDETILDAAERAGAGLPFGCLTGACATCTARLIEGDLDHRRSPRALKQRHREAGYVLPCIGVAGSACVLEVGAEIQADLVPNPWK